jgi:hypothetical protein
MQPFEQRAAQFKAAAFIGIRSSDQGLALSFFIKDKEIELTDLGVMIGGLKMVQDEFRQAFRQLHANGHSQTGPASKSKSRKARRRRSK